jgi:hypothetical protein
VPRDAALWAGKAGTTRRRILNSIVGLAQERQSLEVEETLERVAELVGLQSAGTVWERIRELETAGWLVRLVTGRKGRFGSVWRIEVPPRLRPARCRPSPNRDIKKKAFDPPPLTLFAEEESLKPRLPAPCDTTPDTPNPKGAPKEEPPAGRGEASSLPQDRPQPTSTAPSNPEPRRTQVTRSEPSQAPVGSGVDLGLGFVSLRPARPVWPPAEYAPMRAAVECAAGGSCPVVHPRLASQVRAVTRALLASDFRPADVAAVIAKVGQCAPLRLRAILEGGHVDLPPRPAPELAAGPGRDLLLALVAALPAVDTDARPRPQVRDREVEERAEALGWEVERARQLAALLPPRAPISRVVKGGGVRGVRT